MDGIYERIEELCKTSQITVTELCRECSIPRATMSDFKQGRSKTLSASALSKIANYFEISVEYLIKGELSKAGKEELKVALFGGGTNVTDAMWEEVIRYAQYIKERENGS
ncbi:MAG: helix-turn-helix transcriptional regulator [Acutalibacteraceae bacterium]|nr:helix-turn-helix transcriptional regulator [Acutalibacteraceae bacterium]